MIPRQANRSALRLRQQARLQLKSPKRRPTPTNPARLQDKFSIGSKYSRECSALQRGPHSSNHVDRICRRSRRPGIPPSQHALDHDPKRRQYFLDNQIGRLIADVHETYGAAFGTYTPHRAQWSSGVGHYGGGDCVQIVDPELPKSPRWLLPPSGG